ncbi:hypothetical protein pb186bvf_013560 [Paramecium bursaria]
MDDNLLARIVSGLPIFKILDEFQSQKQFRSSELNQRQILSSIQKSIPQATDPFQYGQNEIKSVLLLMEDQLTRKIPLYQEIPKYRKPSKYDPECEEKEAKKQRVDKNKCRICKNSTIPMILNLLKQESSANHTTMKSIRQSIVSQQKTNDLSEQKIPYIAFDYSGGIVICKRCRFKFHAECAGVIDKDIEWICQYCETRIKELKQTNQWDYKNNKQLKLSDQKRPQQNQLIERISKKKKVFFIEYEQPKRYDKHRFLRQYPLYDDGHNQIRYPIYEPFAFDFEGIFEKKKKPRPYMINNPFVEDIIKIQTTVQVLFPKMPTPTNVNQDYIEKNFYDIMLNYVKLYIEELFENSTEKLDYYYEKMSQQAQVFFDLLGFVFYSIQEKNFSIKKICLLIVKNLYYIIDSPNDEEILQIKENEISLEDQITILSFLVDGLYELDHVKAIIKPRESKYPGEIRTNQFRQLYFQNPSAYVNQALYLGQDCEEAIYYYFPYVPSSIFVQSKEGWGQYTHSDIPDLLHSLNSKGVTESQLSENLQVILDIKLTDNVTPSKPLIKDQKLQYYMTINELIEDLTLFMNYFDDFVKESGLFWLTSKDFESYTDQLEIIEDEQELYAFSKQLFKSLIYVRRQDSNKQKLMKIFDNDIQIALKLYSFIDHMENLAEVYLALIIIKKLIDDFAIQYPAERYSKIEDEIEKKKKVKPQPVKIETKPKLKKLVKLETIQENERKELKEAKEELKKEKKELKESKESKEPKETKETKETKKQSEKQKNLLDLLEEKPKIYVKGPKISKLSKLKRQQEKVVKKQEIEIQDLSLANRRGKREKAGKNPNINFENTDSKRICLNCTKPISVAKQEKCIKCQKIYHADCLTKYICFQCPQKRK